MRQAGYLESDTGDERAVNAPRQATTTTACAATAYDAVRLSLINVREGRKVDLGMIGSALRWAPGR
jgi:hypothetical protein